MTNVIRYDNGRGPSTALWRKNAPSNGQLWGDPSRGWGVYDDLLNLKASGIDYIRLEGDATASVALVATEVGGVVRLATTTTDNIEAGFGYGIATCAPFKFTAGEGELYFEARVRCSSVTDNVNSLFLGLVEEGGVAANFIVDAGADIADKDCVGFFVKADDGNAADSIFQTAGSAFTTVQAGAAVLVADTWTKLGIHYDGNSVVSFWQDGVKCSTTTTSGATGFPDGEEMSFMLFTKVSSAATLNVDIDWWAAAQTSE